MRLLKLIGSVINRENCRTAQPHLRFAPVRLRQPEPAALRIDMVDIYLLDPERWILGWLSFHPGDRIVFGINPDLAAVEKLVLHFWFDSKYIERSPTLRCFRLKHKVIVGWGQRRFLLARVIPLSLDKLLEHVVDKHMGTGFIDYLKTLSGSCDVGRLYVHVCCLFSSQTVEHHVVVDR